MDIPHIDRARELSRANAGIKQRAELLRQAQEEADRKAVYNRCYNRWLANARISFEDGIKRAISEGDREWDFTVCIECYDDETAWDDVVSVVAEELIQHGYVLKELSREQYEDDDDLYIKIGVEW